MKAGPFGMMKKTYISVLSILFLPGLDVICSFYLFSLIINDEKNIHFSLNKEQLLPNHVKIQLFLNKKDIAATEGS